MKASQHCIDFIKKFESFSSVPYECSGGKKTIGYGHVIQDGEKLSSVSPSLGNEILKKDIEWVEHALNKDFPSLSQNQFDALVSFVFNIGHGRFLNSSVYKFLKINDTEKAIESWKEYTKSNGKTLSGLVRRRDEEIRMFLGA